MKTKFSRVFTLLVDGTPTLAFEAQNTQQAQQLCKESWLRADLLELSSKGAAVCSLTSNLSVRPSTQEEALTYNKAGASLTEQFEDMLLTYLIELDGMPK